MFSPKVHTARRKLLGAILDTPESNPASLDCQEPAERDIIDPELLAGADQAAFYDLEELEEQYENYMSKPFNFSTLMFLTDKILPPGFAPDSISLFKLLIPGHSSTQHLAYKLQGLRSISLQLTNVGCGHPSLIEQCDSLINAVNLDIQSLVLAAWKQRSSQHAHRNMIAQDNIQIVDPESHYLMRPFASPLATSVVILTAVVHAIMGVARESCNYILSALQCTLAMAASMQSPHSAKFIHKHTGEIPTTLPTALHYLNLVPRFRTYTTCPKCSALYDEQSGSAVPQACTNKNLEELVCGESLHTARYCGGKIRHRPTARYSHFPLENWLSELLLRPGVEDMLESTTPSPGSTLYDVWNAPYLCSFPGTGQPSFFDAPPGELRLAMLLFHDFFNPFTNKTSGKLYSIGCFFMVCLNLPADIRYNTSHAYLASIVPGPFEAKTIDLHHFVRPIAENLEELYSPGVWISKTYKYPQGRRVQVAAPLSCLDTPAARAFGGFAPHSHTCFCNMCTARLVQLHHSDLECFQLRDIVSHREQVAQWLQASSLSQQKQVYDRYGVRNCEWLRFPWWNPFVGMPVRPMHWTKNICKKQLRHNMGWSWENLTGIPSAPNLPRPVSDQEYDWGRKALYCLNGDEFMHSKLTSGLAHYLCRNLGIYEAGVSTEGLLLALNEWRINNGILGPDGQLVDMTELDENRAAMALARAHFYLSKATKPSQVETHASASDLETLCIKFQLDSRGNKKQLAERLFDYHSKFRLNYLRDVENTSNLALSVLGADILTEVQNDMGRTTLPRWLKHPPKNFATTAHGKIQAEEYKSLAMVSFVLTLIRVWGRRPAGDGLRERLDHFLHLMLCVRILAFQSLVESDILAFETHYKIYLERLTTLYPYDSRTSIQHMGLHIPTLLCALGPSTRYSKSTCEMFIGLLQDISTNFKFGEMEFTLHREFVMAARLKGLLENDQSVRHLGDFGELTRQYIRKRVPGCAQQGWQSAHSTSPVYLEDSVHNSLVSWARSSGSRIFPRRLFLCTSIQRGNVLYAPWTNAPGDSCVLFSPPGEDPLQPVPGRIESILEDPESEASAGSRPRVLLLIRLFTQLEPQFTARDPYWNNPVVGENGARLARIYYDEVADLTYVVEPRDLISHVAVCNYHNPDRIFSRPCVVVLSLDLKHQRYA